MSKLPPLRRLRLEDFQSESEWIGPLFQILNEYMERTTNQFNRGITLNGNMAAKIERVRFNGTYPVYVKWDLALRPKAVLVGNIERADGGDPDVVRPPYVDWSFTQNGQLKINGLVGFTTYPVTFKSTAVNTGTDIIEIPGHSLRTGLKVQLTNTNGAVPTGLTNEAYYWVIKEDADDIKLASSRTNAVAGTAVDVTGTGTGTQTLTPTMDEPHYITIVCFTE